MRPLIVAALSLLSACAEDPVGRIPAPPCPERMVHLPEVDVCIDRHEARIVDGRAESAEGQLPTEGIDWDGANAACVAAGFRLCRVEEWTFACSGERTREAGGRTQPYGAELVPGRCNTMDGQAQGTGALARGGDRAGCVTPEGVHDLVGNVFEWLGDDGADLSLRELRGGCYGSFEPQAQCAPERAMFQPPDSAVSCRGFRCCADPRRAAQRVGAGEGR